MNNCLLLENPEYDTTVSTMSANQKPFTHVKHEIKLTSRTDGTREGTLILHGFIQMDT